MGLVKAHFDDLSSRGFGETGDRAVCLDCIVDEGLREQTRSILTEPECTFCGRHAGDQGGAVAADFAEFMRIVVGAIRFFYERSIDSLFWDDDITQRYDSIDVVNDVCDGAVSDEVLRGIVEVIDEEDWNDDPGALQPDHALRSAWDNFCELVKHQTRFVFLSLPEEHSNHPDEFTTRELLDKLVAIMLGQCLLVEIPPGRRFWRGRMTDEFDPSTYNAAKLGSPPPDKASSNRMSPAGIPMFYGCDDVATVVAEIGAHSLKRFAVLGEFETTRQLCLIDLTQMPPIPSLFLPDHRSGYYDVRFLHGFARDFSSPVALDGREHIEYVPTQVVTEYLRWYPKQIDGLLYPSAQNNGTCCVLFFSPDDCGDEDTSDNVALRLVTGSVKAVRVVSAVFET